MILKTIKSEGLAQLSYFLSDEASHKAIVIDPRRDAEVYLELADAHECAIRAVFETHVHADFACGSRELAQATGAPIYTGPDSQQNFSHRELADEDSLDFGSLRLQVIHTPGHSPEHICLLVSSEEENPEHPWGLFTGDTLFSGSVGRPDLSADHSPEELAKQLYHSLYKRLNEIADNVLVFPGHGSGSACGADIGERDLTTLGYERRTNASLQHSNQQSFIDSVLKNQPEAPVFYERLKQQNKDGFAPTHDKVKADPLPTPTFEELGKSSKARVLDVRSVSAFHGSHVPGSIHIGLEASFDNWAGWILQPEDMVLLVAESASDAQTVARRLFRLGIDNVRGYLAGGVSAWVESGKPFESIPLTSQFASYAEATDIEHRKLLDVRTEAEWDSAKLPDATHLSLPDLIRGKGDLDDDTLYTTYCGSGYRASIAASLLRQRGHRRVETIAGSMKAWKSAGLPTA